MTLRQAHLEGFDLHANVWVSANDRAGLERLYRYVLAPPFAQERLRLRSDGRVALELKMAWHDGTRELVFEPLEFLERLAAMTRGRKPTCSFAMVYWPRVPAGARAWSRTGAWRLSPRPWRRLGAGSEGVGAKSGSRAWTWATLMHRAFGIDVLACPHCGGRLRLIATLHDPVVIRKLLAHLGMACSGPSPGPAPPQSGGVAP